MTLISLFISLLTMLPMQSVPYSVAHRGGHIKGYVPENSPDGVASAKRYGFRAIECDVHYTKDHHQPYYGQRQRPLPYRKTGRIRSNKFCRAS